MKRVSWREWWRAHSQDIWALVVILIFFLTFFHPVFFSGKLFIINDAFVEYHPLRVAVFGELRHGRLPLWTPLIMSGYPLLSMSHIGVAYPLTWGYLGLPGYLAEQGFIIAPYLLTPVFIYAYVREIRLSRLAGLLAGLTFSYGGLMVSAVANNGLLPNAVMWLPLMLIAIDRVRTRPFVPCLLGATAAYSMSVLTGVAQGFLYSGVVAVSYGAFLVFATDSFGVKAGETHRWREWQRWQPLLVAAGAVLLSAGVAAFQILETMRAARRSIRSVLSYELFTEGAYTLPQWFKAFLFPLHYINHATPYVPLIAIVLAVFGVVAATRNRSRDVRIFFWLAAAIVSGILMLGRNTAIYQILYYIPFINSFRAPARHAFEWTFAVAILSAYGWDAARLAFAEARRGLGKSEAKKKLAGLALTLGSLTIMLLWRADFAKVPPLRDESNHYPAYSELRYVGWKLLFAVLVLSAVWLSWKISSAKWRAGLLAGIIGLACFAEPSIMASRWWWPALKTPDRFTTPSPTTGFLQDYPADQNRIYTRAVLWTEEYQQQPRLDSGNLTMLYGLRNAGGYEPLILERYSRALGGVWMDSSNPRPGFKANTALFEPHSHVLDILNTTFVVGYADLLTEPTLLIEREGIRFSDPDISKGLKPGETMRLIGAARECDTLAIVTTMADSGQEVDGATVAKLRLYTSDGRVLERNLSAGLDTAEWAHERPDVLPHIRHRLARVFARYPGDESNSFASYRYWTRIPLGERVQVDRIEITNTSASAEIALWKMTLYDSSTGVSMPLPHYDLKRWEPVYQKDGVEIIHNKRALARVWLVAEAEAVDGEEALRRIRGESEQPFDPKRTALLEVPSNELPRLPGGPISRDAIAQLRAAEPNRMLIETQSTTPSVLVVSEMIYPGWVATVDGREVPIHATNFILRGVAVPAGAHLVELRYTAPAARNGAFISLLTLLLMGLLFIGYRGRHTESFRAAEKRIRAIASWSSGAVRRIWLESDPQPLVVQRASRLAESRSWSFLLCLAFTTGMIFNCVFPLNAVWSTDGIVESDCAQAMWNLWAVNEAITSGQNPYATSLVYYPVGAPNLSHQAIAAGFFPVTFLVKTLTGGSALYPLYTYRLLIWFCLTLLLYSSYRLLRELGFEWRVAATAAVAFSFSDFFMEHIAHINILGGFFIPLAALCIVRLFRQPEKSANVIWTAAILACAVYFTESTFYIFLAAFFLVVFISLFPGERRRLVEKLRLTGWRRLLLGSAIFLLLTGPYLILLLMDDSIKPEFTEHAFFSANLASFFLPHPQRTPLYGTLFSPLVSRIRVGVGSYEVFISFVLLVFALVAMLTTKLRLVRIAALTALVFFVLSLGPTLKVFETDTGITLPYAFLMGFPPFDWGRTPSRFVVIGMFFVMIVAASGLSWLERAVARRRGWGASSTLITVMLVWAIAEAYPPTPRQQAFVPSRDLEKSVTGPVLNLPVFNGDGYAMLLQLFHHQPIATGYLARSSPQRRKHIVELRRLFDKGGSELCERVARMGVKTVIIAPDSYIARVAPDMGPVNLGQCSLNVIDQRTRDDTASRTTLSDQPVAFPEFDVGTTVTFNAGDANPFLWYGWGGIEPHSRWSTKGTATFVFSLKEVGDRLIRIQMSPFLAPGKLEAQRVKIQLNGHPIPALTLTDPQPRVYALRVPAAALQDKNVLTFDLPDADSPISLGVSGEARLLGINVYWIKLDLADINPKEAPADFTVDLEFDQGR